MKKAFSVIISAALVCTMLLTAGCTSKNDDISDKTVKNDIYDTYEEIKDVSADAVTAGDISKWVLKWAKKNDITAKEIGNGNILLSKGATSGYKDAGVSTLQCSITDDESSHDHGGQCSSRGRGDQQDAFSLLQISADHPGRYHRQPEH